MARSGGRRWWIGGCAGLAGLVLLAIAVVAGMTAWAVRTARIERPSIEHRVPTPPAVPAEAPAATEAAGSVIASPDPGRVVLDFVGGLLFIEPGRPGEPIGLQATYDRNFYRLEERMEPGPPWTYRVTFKPTRPLLFVGIKEMVTGNPSVRLRLPVDAPLALDVRMEKGMSDVDLGRGWITSGDFQVDGTILELNVSGPSRAALERLRIRGSKSTLQARALHKISPRELNIELRMSGGQLDLRGRWKADSRIRIDNSMADLLVRLPRDARIRGLETDRVLAAQTGELPLPTLEFEISKGVRSKVKVFD